MITASINRTEPQQVAEMGRVAWADMKFNESHVSVEAVAEHCKSLAKSDGIVNPEIIVTLEQ